MHRSIVHPRLAAVLLAAWLLAGCSAQDEGVPGASPADAGAGETVPGAGSAAAESPRAAATAATPPAAATPTATLPSAPSPTPTFTPDPTPTNGNLCIQKFSDLDQDGILDTKEPLLPGWSFTISQGQSLVTTVVTTSTGGVCLPLPVGTYTVAEVLQAGWVPTTPPSQTVFIPGGTMVFLTFGNHQLSEQVPNPGPTATD